MEGAPDELEVKPAAFNHRFIAYVIDFAPFAAAFLLTAAAMAKSPPLADQLAGLRLPAVFLGSYVLYQAVGNMAGGTPGKRMMGLYVVRRSDGEKPGPLRAFARALAHLASYPLFNLGFGVALAHPESRALHDLLTGTVVVEPQQKSAGASALLFVGAIVLLVALEAAMYASWILPPTRADLAAVDKAKEALHVMAQIQEEYKAQHQSYTADLTALAKASGDDAKFRAALTDLFVGETFQIQAGNKAYTITASARDRRRTRVRLDGPPPNVRSE